MNTSSKLLENFQRKPITDEDVFCIFRSTTLRMELFTVKVWASGRTMGKLACTFVLTFDGLTRMSKYAAGMLCRAIAQIVNMSGGWGSARV